MPKKNYHIILIDDYRNGLETFSDLLRCWGYKVTPVMNGKEALRLVDENSCDLVITNLTDFPRIDALRSKEVGEIPDMTNVEVLKEVKRKRPTLPVVVFAPYSSSNFAAEIKRQGAADHIRRPFSLEELKSRIDNVLRTAAKASKACRADQN
jgi:DNA-binding NtrC family response regulator